MSSDRRAWWSEGDESGTSALHRCLAVVTPTSQGGTPRSSACRGSGTGWHDGKKSKEHYMQGCLHGRAWRESRLKEDVGTGACKYVGKHRCTPKT
jgi:hypothetical protein